MEKKLCRIPGCPKPTKGQGYCAGHYHRLMRYGSPLEGGAPRIRAPEDVRFWAKVNKNGLLWNGARCWLWTGTINPYGYGIFSRPNGSNLAHRVACELTDGLIPDGLDCDHLCRNRACVNPAHIDIVTRAVNLGRGIRSIKAIARTHCIQGHALVGENLYYEGNGKRCRTCARRKATASYHRRRHGILSARTHCPQGHPYDLLNTRIRSTGERTCRICHEIRRPLAGAHNLAKTHCPQGHPYDSKNTRFDSTGKRACRACGRERSHAQREQARLKSSAPK